MLAYIIYIYITQEKYDALWLKEMKADVGVYYIYIYNTGEV